MPIFSFTIGELHLFLQLFSSPDPRTLLGDFELGLLCGFLLLLHLALIEGCFPGSGLAIYFCVLHLAHAIHFPGFSHHLCMVSFDLMYPAQAHLHIFAADTPQGALSVRPWTRHWVWRGQDTPQSLLSWCLWLRGSGTDNSQVNK